MSAPCGLRSSTPEQPSIHNSLIDQESAAKDKHGVDQDVTAQKIRGIESA
jgi:hypothetical protein